jgi:uncharacterized LabA/DUF88 family protein
MKFNTAIFYDLENLLKGYGFGQRMIQGLSLKEIYHRIKSAEGIENISIQRAYANWSDSRLGFIKNEILELGIEPIQVFGLSSGNTLKNVADIHLVVDLMDLLHHHNYLQNFVIVSGDGGFASVAKKIREYGKRVIGCAYEKSANKVFKAVCDQFIWIEDPEDNSDYGMGITAHVTDTRAKKILEDIFKLNITQSTTDQIWAKVKEVIQLFEKSPEYRAGLENGISPGAIRELINGAITGFDHTTLGYTKFIEFLQKAIENTNLAVYIIPPSDVKVGLKDKKPAGYTLLDSSNTMQVTDIQVSDPRVQRMHRVIKGIRGTESTEIILNKIKEIITWISQDTEFRNDLRFSGVSPAVLKEAIYTTVANIEIRKLGFSKFIEFLRFVFKGTELCVWQNERLLSDVKVGLRKNNLPFHTIMPDLEMREIHSVEHYKSILAVDAPIFKLPNYEIIKKVAIYFEANPIESTYFSDVVEQIETQMLTEEDAENIKLAVSCFISADCFIREPINARLSEQKLTIKIELNTYDRLINKLKSEMQKKILFSVGDCKPDVFEKMIR